MLLLGNTLALPAYYLEVSFRGRGREGVREGRMEGGTEGRRDEGREGVSHLFCYDITK